jgi:hypothetical protein
MTPVIRTGGALVMGFVCLLIGEPVEFAELPGVALPRRGQHWGSADTHQVLTGLRAFEQSRSQHPELKERQLIRG